MLRTGIVLGAMAVAAAAGAHHSTSLHFDRDDIVEIAGTLTRVDWRNPHTLLTVETRGEDGQAVEWLVESRASSQMVRAGLTQDAFQVGQSTRVAGFRGRENRTSMFMTNIMLADGRELAVEHLAKPRWSADLVGPTVASFDASAIDYSSAEATGIFRVWGRDSNDRGEADTGRTLWNETYPLTEQARSARARWDPVTDDPYTRCRTGMPAIMDQPYPMEFVREGDDIFLYLEEQDTVRRIHMAGGAPAEGRAKSPLGYSQGRWDGEALVVTTTDIDWPWFDQTGIPQTEALELQERFTPSADGHELTYEVTVSDPAVFTEPVTLTRRWIWVPGEQIEPYNCVWDGSTR